MIDQLLAKSGPPSPGSTLQGHTWQVLLAATLLLELRLDAARRATGLALGEVSRIVPLAAFLHDLGKANDIFQRMVQGQHVTQPIRHEALSFHLARTVMRDWLASTYSNVEIDRAAIVAAAHHRKFPRAAVGRSGECEPGARLLLGHPDFRKVAALGVKQLGLPKPPEGLFVDRELARVDAEDAVAEHASDLHDAVADVPLAVAKAFLLAADVLGSAMPVQGERDVFARRQLGNRPSRDEICTIARTRLGGSSPRPFQEAVARSDARVTLATAGCGTGKTVAAYLWAARHAPRQVWFCYPTTGTATEGFRDYLVDVDLDALLQHGRSAVDLELLDLVDGDREDAAHRERERHAALETWGAKAVACTVDTVLGLLQCHRRGMYAWPALADAAFVFDEIHAYDSRLFGSLLRFLSAFPGSPALLMTASLPTARLERLRALVRSVHGNGRELVEVGGPSELQNLERYLRVERSPEDAVRDCLAANGKVLWVCNTVDRSRAVAGRAWPLPALRYHSRYRYEDRVDRHKAVIDAFGRPGPCLAVTTQVCEMSLDLSADLLVTELAPVSSMIQRLGRLNRRAAPGDGAKPFLVVEPEGEAPYTAEELDRARSWIASLPGTAVSQRHLADAWNRMKEGSAETVDESSAWLDGGFETLPRELRDASPSVTVVLAADAGRVRRREVPAVRVAVPMNPPKGREWLQWPRVNGMLLPPEDAVTYSPLEGASWR